MATASWGRCAKYAVIGVLAAGIATIGGCATEEQKGDAIKAINAQFKKEYESILDEQGTRVFAATPAATFDAANAALVRLGMVVQEQSRAAGYLEVKAPAPSPLTKDEWDSAAAVDLPKAREILRQQVGVLALFFHFEPEGLDVVISATIGRNNAAGTRVSLTMRMRETAPPKSGLPRREYPPPSALRVGLDKIFAAIEGELKARPR